MAIRYSLHYHIVIIPQGKKESNLQLIKMVLETDQLKVNWNKRDLLWLASESFKMLLICFSMNNPKNFFFSFLQIEHRGIVYTYIAYFLSVE